jgi:SAM-dependent methyltransferase
VKSGRVNLGDLRSLQPVSKVFGQDRGTPIRRYYIDRFMAQERAVVRGRVLEIGDDRYARAYGAPGTVIEVLDREPSSRGATLTGDLVTGAGIPVARYDAIILTQVLHVLRDMEAALRNAAQALLPGGSLLATLPCVSQVSRYDMDRWGDYWRVTDQGARALFEKAFAAERISVVSFGNVLTAIASLAGLAAEELNATELDTADPDFQVLIAVHARR